MEQVAVGTDSHFIEIKRGASRAGDRQQGVTARPGIGIQPLSTIGRIYTQPPFLQGGKGDVIALNRTHDRIFGVLHVRIAAAERHHGQQRLISIDVQSQCLHGAKAFFQRPVPAHQATARGVSRGGDISTRCAGNGGHQRVTAAACPHVAAVQQNIAIAGQ